MSKRSKNGYRPSPLIRVEDPQALPSLVDTGKPFTEAQLALLRDSVQQGQVGEAHGARRRQGEVKLQLEAPFFKKYLISNGGFLPEEKEAHALFYYALLARKVYEDKYLGREVLLEGDAEAEPAFAKQFRTLAWIYQVEPDRMVRFWPAVDAQLEALNMPAPPAFARFDEVPEIGESDENR